MKNRVLLVSMCFLAPSRYDGKFVTNQAVEKLLSSLIEKGVSIVPICPEQLGGLPTPRKPAEIRGDLVVTSSGTDVTKQFALGARSTLDITKIVGADVALLKQRSPSCGNGEIYDGNFNGSTIKGNGLTAELLIESGIQVFSEKDAEKPSIIAKALCL